MIPKIIHHIHASTTLPALERRYVDSWKKHHPEYIHLLHIDADARNFVIKHFPDYLELFDSFKYLGQRVDLLRYMYLYVYGGVYADTDLECLKNIDVLLEKEKTVFSLEPKDNMLREDFLIANYFIATEPKSKFILRLIVSTLNPPKHIGHKKFDVCNSTGCLMVTREYLTVPDADVKILQSDIFTPVTHQRLLDCRNNNTKPDVPDSAFGVHHFFGSWW